MGHGVVLWEAWKESYSAAWRRDALMFVDNELWTIRKFVYVHFEEIYKCLLF